MKNNQYFISIVEEFRNGQLKVDEWNFCYSKNSDYEMSEFNRNRYTLHIMGAGAEQELASFDQFQTLEQLIGFCNNLGVKEKVFQIG